MGKQIFGKVPFILLLSACAAAARGQVGGAPGDTVSMNRIVLIDPGVSLGRAVFQFPASLGTGLSFSDPSMTLPGDGLYPGASFIGRVLEPRADLMSPLRLQMEKEKMSPFQTALGAIQVGAVGYMAYRHIKKYGLFR